MKKRKFLTKDHQLNQPVPTQSLDMQTDQLLSGDLEDTIQNLQKLLSENEDFVIRRFHVFGHFPAVMFFFTNLIDQAVINTDILKPLMFVPPHLADKEIHQDQLLDVLLHETIYHSETETENRYIKLVDSLLRGDTVIAIEGLDQAFHIGTRNLDKRAIEQPETEKTILGPREGFVELLGTNIA